MEEPRFEIQVTKVVNTTIVRIDGDAFYVRINERNGSFRLQTYRVESTYVRMMYAEMYDDVQDAIGNAVKHVVEFHNG